MIETIQLMAGWVSQLASYAAISNLPFSNNVHAWWALSLLSYLAPCERHVVNMLSTYVASVASLSHPEMT